MCSEIAIQVNDLSKIFATYSSPRDRLVQGAFTLLSRLSPSQKVKSYLLASAEARRCEYHALHKVTFEVPKGQTVGIIGRNGSGKSTLLQIICGTLAPTHGKARFAGKVAALLELGSGFNPEFTGKENVYLSGQLYGLSKKQIEERYANIVEFADIGAFVDQPVKTYSSGMLVRLAFSVIAHVDAEILIIDEALAVGDAFFTQKCMRFLRKFMEKGTVLFVSHDTATVKSLCSHVVWLDHGKLIQQGDPKEVCDQYLTAFFEAQHGKNPLQGERKSYDHTIIRTNIYHDQRLKYLNASNLRNDLQVFEFDPDASHYGREHAAITEVYFIDDEQQRLNWIVGGEHVCLVVVCQTYQPVRSPIVGFYIKDKLGQSLFGENTYYRYENSPIELSPNIVFKARFRFQMPILPAGDYSVCVALADGTQFEHIQLHWIHDALTFRSESSSISTGLVGIPMNDISIDID